jgi:hypothetical protein
MSKRKDFSQIAFSVVQQATGEAPKPPIKTAKQEAGRKGGLKGGKSRMESLTPEQRSELGRQAREARRTKEALASTKASAKANQLNKVN